MTMWNTVNNWEMYHVFEKVCEDLGNRRKVVVLGGTNNGPAVTNVCPEVREKFLRNFRIAGNNGKGVWGVWGGGFLFHDILGRYFS